jgi:hypothetical protein
MDSLDTYAIIDYLKSEIAAASVLEPIFIRGIALFVSAITKLELFSSPALTVRLWSVRESSARI